MKQKFLGAFSLLVSGELSKDGSIRVVSRVNNYWVHLSNPNLITTLKPLGTIEVQVRPEI